MDPYLRSLVETRQEAISCLKIALENVDVIVKSINQINLQIEMQTHRSRPENDQSSSPPPPPTCAAAEVTSSNNETRRDEIAPNVPLNVIPMESLEFANQACAPDTAVAAATQEITMVPVKSEVVDNQQSDDAATAATDEADESNEEILDSVFSALSAREKTEAEFQPIVRLELLEARATAKKKRRRGRPANRASSTDENVISEEDNRQLIKRNLRRVRKLRKYDESLRSRCLRLRARSRLTDYSYSADDIVEVCTMDDVPKKEE